MNFKKLISIVTFLVFFSGVFVFATQGQDAGSATASLTNSLSFNENGKWLSNFLNNFGEFYNALKSGNGKSSNVVDGIAILVFFAGLYSIFFNLTRFAFKGENNKSARKGASVILSILVTGALVTSLKSGEGFVSYYGGMIIFLMTLFVLLFGYVAYAKWSISQFKNIGARIALLALGLIVIDITMSSIIGRLFVTYSKGGLVYYVYSSLGTIAGIAFPLLFVGLLWWGLIKGDKNSEEDKNSIDSEEDKAKKKKIAKIKALTKSYVDSLKSGFKSSEKKKKKLEEISKFLNEGSS